ncbi:MAG: thioredoxin domain-containing protein [Candidatus Aenigmatarchaeota archaeon]
MKVKISIKFLIFLIALTIIILILNYSLISSRTKLVDLADDDPFLGPADAKVKIIEFSDYSCPFCARVEPTIKQILQNYPHQVRWVYRDFPIHEQGWKAAEAANCAREQGKYWEYHDLLFENQQFLSVRDLKLYAIRLNLNPDKFDTCLDSGKYASEVKKDFNDGKAMGVTGTPTFFINGEIIVGAQPYSVFQAAVEKALAQ